MKKLKLIIVAHFIFLTFSNSFSQTSISIGAETGINIANVSTTPNFSTSSKTCIIIGGILDVNINYRITIVSGLRFNTKGWSNSQGILA